MGHLNGPPRVIKLVFASVVGEPYIRRRILGERRFHCVLNFYSNASNAFGKCPFFIYLERCFHVNPVASR
jgi:hypothetical protein